MKEHVRTHSMTHNPTTSLHHLVWPVERLSEAIDVAARKRGFPVCTTEISSPPSHLLAGNTAYLNHWLQTLGSHMNLDLEPIVMTYGDLEQAVVLAGPALVRLPPSPSAHDTENASEPGFLVILNGTNTSVTLLAPNLTTRRVAARTVCAALRFHLEAPLHDEIHALLDAASIPDHRRSKAFATILRQRLSMHQIRGCWLIRLPPGQHMWSHMRFVRLPSSAIAILGLHIIRKLLELVAWWVIGRGALEGRFEWGWLWAWVLILLTALPLFIIENWQQNNVAIKAGILFKLRMLHGTLQLDPEDIRHQGAGQFLGRVMDLESVEMLALDSGFRAIISIIEIIIATVVLSLGAGGPLHGFVFGMWVVLTFVLGWRYYDHCRRWTDAHRQMTNDLVERMDGHRTRLAQENMQHWHDQEDQQLANYLTLSERMDRTGVTIQALMPYGWLFLGFAGIVTSFVTGSHSPALLAVSLGGIVLAYQSLESLTSGIQNIVNLFIAWQQIAPLYRVASRQQSQHIPDITLLAALDRPPAEQQQAVLVARNLIYRYHARSHAVLNQCTLHVYDGDRILLEGPSGSGKSTLAALLTGLRQPSSGLLLMRGFDQQAIGIDEWRRRIVSAPQFHENHVLSETFAFNLLMGRGWPPEPEDIDDAEDVCYDLGLGDVLERMPAGLQQMVGESGWQLSHGERSRLFIARALLQKADVIILDESFAALDPENLQRALETVLRRAPALIVIAHP